MVALKIQQYCNRPRDRNNFEQLEKRRTVTRTADVRKKGHYSVQGFIVQSTRLSSAVIINLEILSIWKHDYQLGNIIGMFPSKY